MRTTTNYHLKKPDYTDEVDVAPFSTNFDIIDGLIKKYSTAADYVSVKCDTFGYTAPLYDFTINGTAATNTQAASFLASNRNAVIKLTIVDDDVTAEFRYNATFDGTDFYMAYGYENTIWEMVIKEVSGDKYLSTSYYEYENPELKVTSITENSTDAQYPSAKAVYNALKGVARETVVTMQTEKFGRNAIFTNCVIDEEPATTDDAAEYCFNNDVKIQLTETSGNRTLCFNRSEINSSDTVIYSSFSATTMEIYFLIVSNSVQGYRFNTNILSPALKGQSATFIFDVNSNTLKYNGVSKNFVEIGEIIDNHKENEADVEWAIIPLVEKTDTLIRFYGEVDDEGILMMYSLTIDNNDEVRFVINS